MKIKQNKSVEDESYGTKERTVAKVYILHYTEQRRQTEGQAFSPVARVSTRTSRHEIRVQKRRSDYVK